AGKDRLCGDDDRVLRLRERREAGPLLGARPVVGGEPQGGGDPLHSGGGGGSGGGLAGARPAGATLFQAGHLGASGGLAEAPLERGGGRLGAEGCREGVMRGEDDGCKAKREG